MKREDYAKTSSTAPDATPDATPDTTPMLGTTPDTTPTPGTTPDTTPAVAPLLFDGETEAGNHETSLAASGRVTNDPRGADLAEPVANGPGRPQEEEHGPLTSAATLQAADAFVVNEPVPMDAPIPEPTIVPEKLA